RQAGCRTVHGLILLVFGLVAWLSVCLRDAKLPRARVRSLPRGRIYAAELCVCLTFGGLFAAHGPHCKPPPWPQPLPGAPQNRYKRGGFRVKLRIESADITGRKHTEMALTLQLLGAVSLRRDGIPLERTRLRKD